MNLKKKMKNFFTLSRKTDGGFTLIELIVVIAVMAILAGVGTAGYSGYIRASNKGNDKVLVGNIMRALETAVYSGVADYSTAGQFSTGIRVPVGFVVLSDEAISDAASGKSGTVLALSTDGELDPVHQALVNAFGADYSTNYKLSYDEWSAGTIGGSNLYNATADMMGTLGETADLMVALQNVIQMTQEKYDDAGDMVTSVAGNITTKSKKEFVDAWLGATNSSYSGTGFGYGGRENYSAIRIAYNNSFAEYVRANYDGNGDADAIADSIANYGQSAGQLAYDEAYKKSSGLGNWLADKAGKLAQQAANNAAPDAVFSYTANMDAITNDPNFIGYGNDTIKQLYEDWLANAAENDAAAFYDTMVTAATDGKAYYEANGSDAFVNWMEDSAESYAETLSGVQNIVNRYPDASTVVVAAYYQDGLVSFDVFSNEADPRNK